MFQARSVLFFSALLSLSLGELTLKHALPEIKAVYQSILTTQYGDTLIKLLNDGKDPPTTPRITVRLNEPLIVEMNPSVDGFILNEIPVTLIYRIELSGTKHVLVVDKKVSLVVVPKEDRLAIKRCTTDISRLPVRDTSLLHLLFVMAKMDPFLNRPICSALRAANSGPDSDELSADENLKRPLLLIQK